MKDKLLSGVASPIAFFKDAVGRFIKTPLRSTIDGALYIFNAGVTGTPVSQTEVIQGSIVAFVFDPPVKSVSVQIRANAGAIPDPDEAVIYCYDPPNAGVAADWLDEANNAPRECLKLEDGIRERSFDDARIKFLYMKGVGNSPDMVATVTGVV